MQALTSLEAAYRPLLGLADEVDDEEGWGATRLPGWTVRDLLFHLAADAQRALVAFGTPADGPADADAVTYWSAWQPNSDPTRSSLRATRTIASVWTSVREPADLFAETARAVLRVFASADPATVVCTQGRRLSADALLRTLTVEAAVHHLDLDVVLRTPPAAEALVEVRRVVDGLAGGPVLADWDPVRIALVATGRSPLSQQERLELGERADRFPLFG